MALSCPVERGDAALRGRPAKLLFFFSLLVLFVGCATDGQKPKHASGRKWYQGEMDNEDRSFFIDSFFNGQ